MRWFAHLFMCLCIGLAAASCSVTDNPQGDGKALSHEECDTLIRREFGPAPVSASPMTRQLFKSCLSGKGHFNRGYFDCVVASKYSDSLDCAYKARGIDRAMKEPVLKDRKTGEHGHFASAMNSFAGSDHKGEDPRTTIKKSTVDLYLERRDRAFRSVGENPPSRASTGKSTASIDAGGRTFWVVRESFVDTQLVKVMREGQSSFDEVVCARYGSSERIRLDSGYCGALIRKYFDAALSD